MKARLSTAKLEGHRLCLAIEFVGSELRPPATDILGDAIAGIQPNFYGSIDLRPSMC